MMPKPISEQDKEILKNLISSRGQISSQLLSERIGLSLSDTKKRRKEVAEEYLVITYSSILEEFGWRQVELLISTVGGRTMAIGRELLRRGQVAYVARTVGQFTIDLRAEAFIKNSAELIELIEEVKAMEGVRDLIWSEVIEVVGRKNHIPTETLTALKKKAAIKLVR